MLEASGGSGPPKARVLWGPIGTDGVNRRAVSPRSVFAHEPRVVFRDNKRATSSSAGTTTPRFLLLLLLLPFFSFLIPFLQSSLPFPSRDECMNRGNRNSFARGSERTTPVQQPMKRGKRGGGVYREIGGRESMDGCPRNGLAGARAPPAFSPRKIGPGYGSPLW